MGAEVQLLTFSQVIVAAVMFINRREITLLMMAITGEWLARAAGGRPQRHESSSLALTLSYKLTYTLMKNTKLPHTGPLTFLSPVYQLAFCGIRIIEGIFWILFFFLDLSKRRYYYFVSDTHSSHTDT